MEVSHVDDMTTHIVMSNQKSMAVTILDSPELMTLLSGALYKNPAYAMVREVICNAQDAHIEAGIADTPIEISFVNNRLIIRDFGLGIPRNKMAEIYGTYGLSTKKKQKESTGGFGLGSKSPWSFTEIFGVTSYNKGTKTIYRLVRSDPENNGKPGIIPILETESAESGLEVSIPLVSGNKSVLEEYIKTVVMLGDIPAKLDGELLDTIPFNQAKKGFTFVNRHVTKELKTPISVRYGSVVYPLESHVYYETEYWKLVDKLGFQNSYYTTKPHLVLHAEPNTLSIAPSRDHLTLETRTLKTVKALIENMINVLFEDKHYEQDIVAYFKRNPEQNKEMHGISIAQTRKDYELMIAFAKYPNMLKYLKLNNEISQYFRKHEINNPKLFKTFTQYSNPNNRTTKNLNSWVNRYCYAPLYQWQQETSHRTSLHIWGRPRHPDTLHGPSAFYDYFVWNTSPTAVISLARKIVVLTTRITDIHDQFFDDKDVGLFVWVVTTRSKKLEVYAELAESLRSRGFEVIDLATKHWVAPEPRKKKVPKIDEEKVKKPAGYYKLINGVSATRETYSRRVAAANIPTLVETPTAYLEEKNEAFLGMLGRNGNNVLSLLESIPHSGIVVVNLKEEEELIKKGIPHFFEYATQSLNQIVKENRADIRKYLSVKCLIDTVQTRYFKNDYSRKYQVSKLLEQDITRKTLGISSPESFRKMEKFINIYTWLQAVNNHPQINVFSGLAELPEPRVPSEKTVAKVSKCVNSPHMDLFNSSFMFYLKDEHIARKLINILLDYETEE